MANSETIHRALGDAKAKAALRQTPATAKAAPDMPEGFLPCSPDSQRPMAGQVPEFQCSGGIPGFSACKDVRGKRIERNQCHCFDCTEAAPECDGPGAAAAR